MSSAFSNTPLAATLEVALNRYLQFNPNAAAQTASLAGKILALRVREPGLTFYFAPHASGVQVLESVTEEVDATIETGVFELARISLAQDRITARANSDLRITGDAEFAQQFQQILDGVDFDWEELLARGLTRALGPTAGDVLANRIGEGLRGLFSAGKTAFDVFAQDTSTYLRAGSRDLVDSAEAQQFINDVDDLRDATARLEARLTQHESQSENAA